MMALLLACAGARQAPDASTDSAASSVDSADSSVEGADSSPDSADSSPDSADPPVDSADSSADSADSGLPPTSDCPPGMAPIPPEAPLYCMDIYEVVVEGTASRSEAGVLPTEHQSYLAAVEICASTPILDEKGASIGHKHLATAEEWEDAGDGLIGAGGARFSYGDEWDSRLCASWSADGSGPDSLQPTGSYPDCVSAFGVYDQIGNAWEWVDGGAQADALRALEAMELELSADALLRAPDPSALRLQLTGMAPAAPVEGPDGWLILPGELAGAESGGALNRGYLARDTDSEALAWLPIALEFQEGPGSDLQLRFSEVDDGAPIPEKRGCAWYTGDDGGCLLDVAARYHTADFEGSIGFRCASPPLSSLRPAAP